MPTNSLKNFRPAFENREFTAIMDRAYNTNRKRDRADEVSGVIIPKRRGPAAYLNAAISAVQTGVMCREWDSVAEGLAMLEDLKDRYALVLGSKRPARQEAIHEARS